ncbi:MAG TPA: hypothetical protein VGU20_16560 [Stellaceae bacterium]|nr:hypothetical protein [Stellaceae bacterium]
MTTALVHFTDVSGHEVWVNPAAVRYVLQYDRTEDRTTLQFARDDAVIVMGAGEAVARKLGTVRS